MSTNCDTKDETSPLLVSGVSVQTNGVKGHDNLLDRGTRSHPPIRTYWWRWIVLIVFSLNLGMTNILWITAAPIANVVMCYYSVSEFWVNALSEVYMLTYTILLFPAAWFLDRYGLRLSILIGAASDAAGAALKLAGTGVCTCGVYVPVTVCMYPCVCRVWCGRARLSFVIFVFMRI